MAGVRLLDGVHAKGPDSVDREGGDVGHSAKFFLERLRGTGGGNSQVESEGLSQSTGVQTNVLCRTRLFNGQCHECCQAALERQ